MTEVCLVLQVHALTLQDIDVHHKKMNFYCRMSWFVVITNLQDMILYLQAFELINSSNWQCFALGLYRGVGGGGVSHRKYTKGDGQF